MFKICLLTWKALHGNAPSYIQDSIVPYNCNFKGLRSSQENVLTVPSGTTKTYGDRALATAAPTVWNRLPQTIRLCDKTLLKTHLFQKVYTC